MKQNLGQSAAKESSGAIRAKENLLFTLKKTVAPQTIEIAERRR
jgi:hypothetical protein